MSYQRCCWLRLISSEVLLLHLPPPPPIPRLPALLRPLQPLSTKVRNPRSESRRGPGPGPPGPHEADSRSPNYYRSSHLGPLLLSPNYLPLT
eukprot:415463-Hanusia_phi.AAC.1